MARAEAGARVPVEVLVEEDVVLPVGIRLHRLVGAVDRATTVGAAQEDPREAAAELPGDLLEVHHLARARRALDLEVVTEVEVIALQGLEDEVVQREPDGAAPVRVAAE